MTKFLVCLLFKRHSVWCFQIIVTLFNLQGTRSITEGSSVFSVRTVLSGSLQNPSPLRNNREYIRPETPCQALFEKKLKFFSASFWKISAIFASSRKIIRLPFHFPETVSPFSRFTETVHLPFPGFRKPFTRRVSKSACKFPSSATRRRSTQTRATHNDHIFSAVQTESSRLCKPVPPSE